MSQYPRQLEECPVCYDKLKVEISAMDLGGPICEQYETCSNGCYDYGFAYGTTEISVNIRDHHIQFGWHYNDDSRDISQAIDLVCDAARRVLIEDILKDKKQLDWLDKSSSRLQDIYWHIENEGGNARSGISFMMQL